MTDANAASWGSLDEFLAENPNRRTVEPISYGDVSEPGERSIPESWDLLWFPATGELVRHRAEATPGVVLVGRCPHRDYIDDEIAEADASDKNVRVHRRRWDVTHPGQESSHHLSWRARGGSGALKSKLAWWERLMEGRFLHDINDNEPLPDWGHTVDHVDGPLEWNIEAWDELHRIATEVVDEALRLERELRGTYNLATVANLASELQIGSHLLHYALLEAYGKAHRDHPGRLADH